MKRIIKQGRDLNEIEKFECNICGCIFETDESEIAFELNKFGLVSNCPNCSKLIFKNKEKEN